MKRALIVGVTGQDGTLLAGLLRARGVACLGCSSRGATDEQGREVGPLDLLDGKAVETFVARHRPDRVFYLAAHHHAAQEKLDGGNPELWRKSFDVQVTGLVHVLEALQRQAPEARLFYASSSHVFGSAAVAPQTEATPLRPESIYAISKVAGHHACRFYREQHGLFAAVGVLYNHESVLRAGKFLSRKIINGALSIRAGRAERLVLGNLAAQADWGYAPDFVDAMVRILDVAQPDDYLVATGQIHEVRDFARIAFDELRLDYLRYVEEDPGLVRGGSPRLTGDASKLRAATGWKPSVTFEEMVRLLVRQAAAGE